VLKYEFRSLLTRAKAAEAEIRRLHHLFGGDDHHYGGKVGEPQPEGC
jgi:hypothetical protein